MTYVYLNYYPNGYLYVGSHTWDGYGVDPNYIGSSGIACYHNWVPSQIEILETCSKEERYEREKYWINHFCKCYGVCEQVSNISSKFASQFKKGLLLNCHTNSFESAHTNEAIAKSLKTRTDNGSLERWYKAGSSPEAIAKMVATNKANGLYDKMHKLAHTDEAHAKMIATRKANGSYDKALDACHSHEARIKAGKTYADKYARRVIDQYGNVYQSGTDIDHNIVHKTFAKGEYSPSFKKCKYYGYVFKPYVKNQENN